MTQRLQYLLQLSAASPNDSFTLFALAKEYEGMGESDQALAYYLKLRDTTPDYVGLYYHLGKLYEQLNQTEKALETYAQGMATARKAGDQHSLSELQGAKLNLELE